MTGKRLTIGGAAPPRAPQESQPCCRLGDPNLSSGCHRAAFTKWLLEFNKTPRAKRSASGMVGSKGSMNAGSSLVLVLVVRALACPSRVELTGAPPPALIHGDTGQRLCENLASAELASFLKERAKVQASVPGATVLEGNVPGGSVNRRAGPGLPLATTAQGRGQPAGPQKGHAVTALGSVFLQRWAGVCPPSARRGCSGRFPVLSFTANRVKWRTWPHPQV